VHVLVLGDPKPDLFEIVHAGASPSGLACSLHGRKHERHKNADDGDYDQEFYKRKPASRS
jgi:hypothetical protein